MAKKRKTSKKSSATRRKRKSSIEKSSRGEKKKKRARKKATKKPSIVKSQRKSRPKQKKRGAKKVVRSVQDSSIRVQGIQTIVNLAVGGSIAAGEKIAPGHASAATGTMGLVVRRGTEMLLLTCAHVVAGGSSPAIIDMNPPVSLLRKPDNLTIGSALQGRRFNWELDQFVDCALLQPQGVAPLPGIPGVPDPLVFSRLTAADKQNGVQLFKLGAETGPSRGTIVSISSPPITMQDGTVVFRQIQIRAVPPPPRFAERGDSGAVVCVGNRVVGLVRGIDSSGFAIACHLPDVAALLNITP